MKVMSSGKYIFIDWKTDRKTNRQRHTGTWTMDIHRHIDRETDIDKDKHPEKKNTINNEYHIPIVLKSFFLS